MTYIHHIFYAVLETGDAQHKKLEENETPESMIVGKELPQEGLLSNFSDPTRIQSFYFVESLLLFLVHGKFHLCQTI